MPGILPAPQKTAVKTNKPNLCPPELIFIEVLDEQTGGEVLAVCQGLDGSLGTGKATRNAVKEGALGPQV